MVQGTIEQRSRLEACRTIFGQWALALLRAAVVTSWSHDELESTYIKAQQLNEALRAEGWNAHERQTEERMAAAEFATARDEVDEASREADAARDRWAANCTALANEQLLMHAEAAIVHDLSQQFDSICDGKSGSSAVVERQLAEVVDSEACFHAEILEALEYLSSAGIATQRAERRSAAFREQIAFATGQYAAAFTTLNVELGRLREEYQRTQYSADHWTVCSTRPGPCGGAKPLVL
jgi:hypothetical protein